MDKSITITKSDYQLFLDAPLHLWAYKHGKINSTPTKFETHLAEQGYEAEELAEKYLEQYILNTAEAESIEFQRVFTDRQFLARTDALVFKPKSNTYDLYEIKSSTRNKKEFISDAAFQYLIATKDIKIDCVYILHLNKDYVRHSFLDIENLFAVDNISAEVKGNIAEVAAKREKTIAVALSDSPEGIQHCYKPKDCPCLDLCHPVFPKHSIYSIPRITKKKKIQLLEQGILEIKNLPDTFPLNDKQRKIVEITKKNEAYIDKEAIKQEFNNFEYPLYFLDYETFLSAIPLFDTYHPQQQMVFQYSLHKMDTFDGEAVHSEHLSTTKNDPSTSLVTELKKSIGNTGTVFVWNKAFEITRNKEMAQINPKYADFLNELNNRIYDLGDFIKKGFYLHPDFLGSWSIKKVLPVMVPELSYEGMDIGKGDQAMMAWWDLVNDELPDHKAEKTKTALLEYCKLDSYAMVVCCLSAKWKNGIHVIVHKRSQNHEKKAQALQSG
ncbi:MAG: DUF2779 domain-containing protein, partial [Anaerolineae bacterium]|nr:DUF2779 domain-containing protein [Anaerolineae bacterium]